MGPTDASSASVADLAAVYAMVRAGTDDSHPPEDQPVAKALAGVSSHEEDTEIRRPGRAVPLEVWASPVRADDAYVQGTQIVTAGITGTSGGNFEALATSSTVSCSESLWRRLAMSAGGVASGVPNR